MDYEVLYAISEVYSIQKIYKTFGLQLVEADMNISVMRAALGHSSDNDHTMEVLSPRFAFLLQVEDQLLTSYKALVLDMGG